MVTEAAAPIPPVQFTPALSEQLQRTPPRPAAPTPKSDPHLRGKRSPAGDRQAQMARVLQVAARMEQPFRLGQLSQKLGDVNHHTLTDYVAAFVAAKAITKTGERAGTRYTVAANVDASKLQGLASPAQPAQTAKPTIGDKELTEALKRLLATGASYEARELTKKLRNDYPDLHIATVAAALEALVTARFVERIPSGFSGEPRFRKRAA